MTINNLFLNQLNSANTEPEHVKLNQDIIIQFFIKESSYAVPIEFVREVIPNQDITPYPYIIPGHCGVLSLRGQIIPVLEFGEQEEMEDEINRRIIVFEFDQYQFCLFVSRPKRLQIQGGLTGSPINCDGIPVRILSAQDFDLPKGDQIENS